MLGDEDGAWILVQSEPSGAVSVSQPPSLIARFFSLQEFLHGLTACEEVSRFGGSPQTAKVNARKQLSLGIGSGRKRNPAMDRGIPLDGQKTLCKKVGNVSATESSRAG